MSRTSSVLERTSFDTSLRTTGLLKRSGINTAMAGLICQTVRIMPGQEACTVLSYEEDKLVAFNTSTNAAAAVPITSVPRLGSLVGLAQTLNLKISFSVRSRRG